MVRYTDPYPIGIERVAHDAVILDVRPWSKVAGDTMSFAILREEDALAFGATAPDNAILRLAWIEGEGEIAIPGPGAIEASLGGEGVVITTPERMRVVRVGEGVVVLSYFYRSSAPEITIPLTYDDQARLGGLKAGHSMMMFFVLRPRRRS